MLRTFMEVYVYLVCIASAFSLVVEVYKIVRKKFSK